MQRYPEEFASTSLTAEGRGKLVPNQGDENCCWLV